MSGRQLCQPDFPASPNESGGLLSPVVAEVQRVCTTNTKYATVLKMI
jgi:hypothetical protein